MPTHPVTNVVAWFEIPVTNMDRAAKFYETILNISIDIVTVNQGRVGHLVSDNSIGGVSDNGIGGALVENMQLGYQPADVGSLVYLAGGEDLSEVLDRVEDAGGKVLLAKTPLGEYGFAALFRDTEGNKVGLRSAS
ncbi:MAG: VOC family protein [Deinococcota bacterium]